MPAVANAQAERGDILTRNQSQSQSRSQSTHGPFNVQPITRKQQSKRDKTKHERLLAHKAKRRVGKKDHFKRLRDDNIGGT